ncbi:hypothetical protein BP6252_01690 [Coleophoma cylindrospora]|uniref:Inhibitor I9 domain-containing protein n=1 Tax=Coleophoma cylindrospora TaxID=1849047 RepID=A0A3D8SV45_9HELO|nr:hypothetical protein BP6252_01690 [Coleophoma cylindrospora]
MASGSASKPGGTEDPRIGTTVSLSANGINALSTLTITDSKDVELPTYTIWPKDGLDADSLEALLGTFIEDMNRDVVHRSVSGHGVLYFAAPLTPSQLAEISKHYQCLSVDQRPAPGTAVDPIDRRFFNSGKSSHRRETQKVPKSPDVE